MCARIVSSGMQRCVVKNIYTARRRKAPLTLRFGAFMGRRLNFSAGREYAGWPRKSTYSRVELYCRILNLPTNTQSHYVHSSLLRYHRPLLSISLPLIQLTFRLHTSQSVARFVVGIQNHIQMSLARCSDSQAVGRRFLCSRYPRFEFPDFSSNICIFFKCQSPISCPGSLANFWKLLTAWRSRTQNFPLSSSALSLVIDSCIERRANNT